MARLITNARCGYVQRTPLGAASPQTLGAGTDGRHSGALLRSADRNVSRGRNGDGADGSDCSYGATHDVIVSMSTGSASMRSFFPLGLSAAR